jgi:hypothetical protein
MQRELQEHASTGREWQRPGPNSSWAIAVKRERQKEQPQDKGSNSCGTHKVLEIFKKRPAHHVSH